MKNDIKILKTRFDCNHTDIDLTCNDKKVNLWWYSLSEISADKCHFNIDGIRFYGEDLTDTMRECIEAGIKTIDDHKEAKKRSLEIASKSIEYTNRCS